MKIVTTKEKLEPVLFRAERVTSKTATLPVLGCVLFFVEKGILTVRATNLDIGVEFSLPVKMEKEGVVAVPSGALRALVVGARQGSTITLEAKEGNLLVTTNQHKAKLKTFPHDDFPVIPRISKEKTITLPADTIVRALKAVWYAAAISTIKPELASVYVYTQKNTLVSAATDAFRLAEKKSLVENAPEGISFLLPVKNTQDCIRILEEVGGTVTVCLSLHQIGIYHDTYYLYARVVEGVFPDYHQIIPQQKTAEVVLLKYDLLAALKTMAAFANTLHQIQLHVSPKKGEFFLTSQNNDVGECRENIPATLEGEDITITVNHRYFLDCFQSLSSDSISLTFSEPLKPVIVRGIADSSFLYLIMPMSV